MSKPKGGQVAPIGVVKKPVNDVIVTALKSLLELAESGDITGIAYYAEDGGKRYRTNAIGSIDEVQALGAIEVLKLPIIEHIMEQRRNG